jgi:hypothetical protein
MAKNIEVTLTLNTQGFDKKLKSAKGSMAGFGAGAATAKGSMIGLAARFAPLAAGVVALGAAFKGLGASVRTASDFQKIETTLTNLTGSAAKGRAALDQLIETATELPLSFEELAAAQPTLATVSPTLKDLEKNTRLAADIAGQFGISFTDAAGQLQRAFSAGAGAADIFREKGVLSAAGFEAGVSYSIEETQAKLAEFGGSIEGAAQNLNNTLGGALSQVGDRFTMFKKSVGDAILPEFQGFLEALNSVLLKNGSNLDDVGASIGTGIVSGFKAAGQAIALIIDIFFTLRDTVTSIFNALSPEFSGFWTGFLEIGKEALNWLINKLIDFGETFGNLLDYIPGVGDGMSQFFGALREDFNSADGGLSNLASSFGENFDKIIVTNRTARDALGGFFDDMDTGAERIRAAAEAAAEASKEVTEDATIAIAQNAEAAKEAAEAAVTAFAALQEAFADVSSLEEYNILLQALQDMLGSGSITMAEFRAAKKELDDSLAKGSEPLLNFIDTLGSAQKALADDLTTAFMEGQSAGDAFQSFFKKMVAQMISDALRLAIIQPILSSIFGAFGIPIEFAPGGGASLKPRAMGGPVLANQPYVVGEKGPEVFMPRVGGTILPNAQSGAGAGGGSIVYNISAVDTQSFRQALARDPEYVYNLTQVGARRQPR